MARKLDIADGHPEGIGNELKSSSPSSVFGMARTIAVVKAMLAICLIPQAQYRANEFLHHFCQFLAMWILTKNTLL
jgi:hypothetical protein